MEIARRVMADVMLGERELAALLCARHRDREQPAHFLDALVKKKVETAPASRGDLGACMQVPSQGGAGSSMSLSDRN